MDTTPATAPSDRVKNDLRSVDHLSNLNESRRVELWRTRAIMDGGKAGLQALLGDLDGYDEDELSLVPTANLMLSGIERFAHKLGRVPDLRITPPVTKDTDRARKKADKQTRIVMSYDERDGMEMLLPQIARWIVGYGFASFTMADCWVDGCGYPKLELRDPYETYPGEFGVEQQPREIAYKRMVPVMRVAEMYPALRPRLEKLRQWTIAMNGSRSSSGVILGSGPSGRSWDNRSGDGVEIVELVDQRGTHVMLPDLMASLELIPNKCHAPPFRLMKRFAFNDLRGHFEHVVGLASSMAKFNLLMQIGMEDSVFSETNVFGNEDDAAGYERGRDALNMLSAQARVERAQTRVPFEAMQHLGTLERMLRATSRYSAQADGDSPNSFATGRGLEQLATGFDAEIREYFLTLRYGLQAVDALRLEYDRAMFPHSKPMEGVCKGEEFAETYNPATDIVTLKTRRTYGAMSGFDEPSKIATMLNLNQAGFMSTQTGMENLDGIDNVEREKERIREEKAMGILLAGIEAMASQGDPKSMMALVDLMDSKDAKQVLRKHFTPQDPQMSPEEEAFGQPPPELTPLPAQPPDIATVLSRATDSGASLGVQRVGRV